jgi:hypothetical protein
MTTRGTSALSAALALLACLGCGGSHETSGATTATLHATRSALTRIPQVNKPPSPGGSSFIVSDELAGGGHADAYCVASPRPKTEWCAVTVVRPEGQVTAEGIFVNAPKLSGEIPLLSGSGDYEGVVGTLVTSGIADRSELVTLKLR